MNRRKITRRIFASTIGIAGVVAATFFTATPAQAQNAGTYNFGINSHGGAVYVSGTIKFQPSSTASGKYTITNLVGKDFAADGYGPYFQDTSTGSIQQRSCAAGVNNSCTMSPGTSGTDPGYVDVAVCLGRQDSVIVSSCNRFHIYPNGDSVNIS